MDLSPSYPVSCWFCSTRSTMSKVFKIGETIINIIMSSKSNNFSYFHLINQLLVNSIRKQSKINFLLDLQ